MHVVAKLTLALPRRDKVPVWQQDFGPILCMVRRPVAAGQRALLKLVPPDHYCCRAEAQTKQAQNLLRLSFGNVTVPQIQALAMQASSFATVNCACSAGSRGKSQTGGKLR